MSSLIASIKFTEDQEAIIDFESNSNALSSKNIWASFWTVTFRDNRIKNYFIILLNGKKIGSSDKSTYIQIEDFNNIAIEKTTTVIKIQNNIQSINASNFIDIGDYFKINITTKKIEERWRDCVRSFLHEYLENPFFYRKFSIQEIVYEEELSQNFKKSSIPKKTQTSFSLSKDLVKTNEHYCILKKEVIAAIIIIAIMLLALFVIHL